MNYITARNGIIGEKETDTGQYSNDSRETGFCHGAAVMCRRTDLDQAGMMDERYFCTTKNWTGAKNLNVLERRYGLPAKRLFTIKNLSA
ncbi:hypothetical protein LWM68_16190 [Niabella sp. W65]|nr:hypothetical protein [Niabella sp. W65]MCH7364161.1 hypothetical protein [Niabella sp. W65]ULT40037.1 hypothetical protein KRR40_35025 [Niabella sp. I65]